MKKIFAVCILSLALLLSLSGCWNSNSPKATAEPSTTPAASAEPTAQVSSSIASGSLWNEGDPDSGSSSASGMGSIAGSDAASGGGAASASTAP